jgi:deoxyribodipyrimidine photo-lyase
MIQPSRIKVLKDGPENPAGKYVLYWLGLSQRACFNPALEHAVDEANARNLPVVVCYGIAEGFPEVNARHWTFLLEGLAEIGPALAKRRIGFVARREGGPVETALAYAADAALVIIDRNYLKPIRAFYDNFVARAPCRVVQVEGDVVVPVETASPKHDYAARTLRPKIYRQWEDYLHPLAERDVRRPADELKLESTLNLADIAGIVAGLKCDHSVGAVKRFKGGHSEADGRLHRYLAGPFAHYATVRGRPEAGAASHMSPYLHFGQISPVAIALAVRSAKGGDAEDRAAYLEELVVRRELAMNHVFYQSDYDELTGIPDWCRKTLQEHRRDRRPYVYTREQFEAGETHDRYWNAAMQEMRETGYMHNHMRMYWGKKIVQWSRSPEEAWEIALRLNNKYFIDGRDANSFTNVGWLFGLHDRPWGTQPVFGTVRSMSEASLKKFDADGYVEEVARLAAAERAG